MTKQTTTVTIDGQRIGQRTSASRTYTHAVVLTAEDPALVLQAIKTDAVEAAARIKELEAAIEAGRVTIRARFRDSSDTDSTGAAWFHGYEITLKGAPRISSHANSKGVVKGGGSYAEDGSYGNYDANLLTPGRVKLLAEARRQVQEELKFIEAGKVRAAAVQAGEFTLRPASVLSWHSSAALAAKAASAASGIHRTRRAIMVPVDAK